MAIVVREAGQEAHGRLVCIDSSNDFQAKAPRGLCETENKQR